MRDAFLVGSDAGQNAARQSVLHGPPLPKLKATLHFISWPGMTFPLQAAPPAVKSQPPCQQLHLPGPHQPRPFWASGLCPAPCVD